ncbi:hypothetical protein ACU5AX_19695 [Sphingomonas sp. XXL09]|uniref:hypothetical protein n=1 Tax=Sphingomonas sp. XXL09 TaxID=3457787 RepID=UPI00406BC69C
MSDAPAPKKFGRGARTPAPSDLDLSDFKPTPATAPSAPMDLPEGYRPGSPARRRRVRETKSKSLTMRITPTTFDRFNDYCDREQISYADAFDRLLNLADTAKE